MDYERFANDLPPPRTAVFTCAEENEETLARHGVTQRMRQLRKGSFRSHLAVLESGDTILVADRFKTAMSFFLEPPTSMVGFLLPRSATGRFRVCGTDMASHELIFLAPGSGADIVTSELAGSEAIVIPAARFIELTERLCRTSKPARPDPVTLIRGRAPGVRALRKIVLELVAHPGADPLGERISNVVARTVALMGSAPRDARNHLFSDSAARRRIAKRVQEYLEENYRNAVRLDQLCRVTGVGIRTLQRSFAEYFDITITEYLKTVRLDGAHRELAAAHPSRCSVTTVALRHGFSHLGRFSVEFHERFGESPSEVLRAARA
jgi:AraC-like DNA-binding protein